MKRTLTLEIPEAIHRALAGHAASAGESIESAGATLLVRAIEAMNQAKGADGPTSSILAVKRGRTGIVWEGPMLELHSFARVNREICLRLIDRGHDLSLDPTSVDARPPRPCPGRATPEAQFRRPIDRSTVVHVRHQWPPSFDPPSDGHWVLMQPWEFGSPPRAWIDPMSDRIDEVWAYSRFIRDSYIAAGVPADRVHVVPLGVDPGRFHPEARPYPLATERPFKFLFLGGTIHRKGIDVLLDAYAATFTASDPICLVIKDVPGDSYYRGQTAAELIDRIRARPGAPEIEYIDRELPADDLAGLYTACDCLVHPYRGEGFGLPIAEAMSCARPVIVTGSGAALDFCNEGNAFLIPSRTMYFRKNRIGSLDTVDTPYLAEPDPAALRDLLRRVVDRPDEAQARGLVAASDVRHHLTWDHAVDAVEARLEQLRSRPIRRTLSHRGGTTDDLPPAPETIASGPVRSGRPRVTLCMIVRDEAAHLADCLGSVSDLVDEMVVVDTGSSDDTAEVAARCGALVHHFTWVDDFAAARNESLRHARGDWIFWLDGDERLDEANRLRLRSLLAGLGDDKAAYLMKQRSPAGPGSAAAVVVDQVRLFRRLPDARWSYRVHEQILPALRHAGADLRRSDVVIQHAGHEDAELRRRKLERDLRLLRIELGEQPDDPFTLFNLGALYHETGRLDDALPLLQRSLDRSGPRDSIVPKLHVLIAGCHRKSRRTEEALEACQAGLVHDPGNAELLFLEALIRHERGDPDGAEAKLLRLLSGSSGAGYDNADDGLRGYKARHNLAVIYEGAGRTAEAEKQWLAAVEENPRFAAGWLRLGELYLRQGRCDELEEAARGLASCPGESTRAQAMRARGRAARPAAPVARPRVSLCMIVRDEEATLGTCLGSVSDLVDEMVVVDTGSVDRTREVAARAGARVINFAWRDDFAAARNESIGRAGGDWVLWLDADERLDGPNRDRLRAIFADLGREPAAYLMRQLSTTDDPYGSLVAADQVRLFRRDPALRWEYRVHEQILLAIRRAGHDLRRTDVVIHHEGYQAPGSSEQKVRRNLELLRKQDADRPNDPITLFHLGQAYHRLGRAAEALPLLRRSLERMPPDYSIRPRLYALIARVHESLGQPAEALEACRDGLEATPDLEELLFLEASLLHDRDDETGAEDRLLRLLRTSPGRGLAAGDAGRRSYKARHLLAEVYRRQGRAAESEEQWRLVVAEQPRFLPAWRSLGDLYRSQERWADLDRVTVALGRANEPDRD